MFSDNAETVETHISVLQCFQSVNIIQFLFDKTVV